MSSFRKALRILVLALVIAAIAAPAAVAGHQDLGSEIALQQMRRERPATPSTPVGGFDWSDAAIGAGTSALVLLAAGALVALYYGRGRLVTR